METDWALEQLPLQDAKEFRMTIVVQEMRLFGQQGIQLAHSCGITPRIFSMIEDRMDDRPSVQSSPPVLIGTIHALHFAGQGNPMSTLVAPGTLGVIGATAYKSRQLRDLGVRPLPGAGTVLIALWDQSDAPLQFD